MKRTTDKKQGGVATIEFALGFFTFWLMVTACMEMSYLSYVSSLGDYAISKASREAKKDTSTYVQTFKEVLAESTSVWSHFVKPTSFRASVQYLQDLNDLYNLKVSDTCLPAEGAQTATCGNESNSALAVYYISYDFNSIFTYFFDADTALSREVIVVQEYERDQF